MDEVGENLIIRKARPCEAEEIWRVTRRAYEPYRGRIKPEFQALRVSVSTIRREIRLKRRVYGVALLDDRIVATLRYRRWRSHLGLSRLAVLPEYQGAGIGKKMMEWAEQQARRLGVRELRGEVRAALPHLLEYYKRMGYRPFARRSGRGYKGYLIAVKKRLP